MAYRLLKDNDYAMTLQEVADELGVTRQYVSVIEKTALKKIAAKLKEWEGYERDSHSDSSTGLFNGRYRNGR